MNPELAPASPDTPDNVTRLTLGDREILLVGTAHVSRKSAEEVERVIAEVRPDAVCVELDPQRYETLVDESRWERLAVGPILAERRAGLFLASLLFAGFQRRLGQRLGTRPGAEMLAAVEAGKKVGAEIVLADRDVLTTLSRCRASLGAVDRLKVSLLLTVLPFASPDLDEAQVEELKTRSAMADAMDTFARQMPALKTPLIDERDQFLAASIANAPGRRIVAVVGAAHAAGIARHIGHPVDRDALLVRPRDTLRDRLRAFVLPVVVAAFVLALALVRGAEPSALALLRVSLSVLVAVAIAGVVSGASVVAIVSAALVAPLSVLLPVVPFGPLVGRMQAALAPPTVADAVRLREDVLVPARARRNRFLTVVLLAVLAPAARSVGAVVGLAWSLSLLRP